MWRDSNAGCRASLLVDTEVGHIRYRRQSHYLITPRARAISNDTILIQPKFTTIRGAAQSRETEYTVSSTAVHHFEGCTVGTQ